MKLAKVCFGLVFLLALLATPANAGEKKGKVKTSSTTKVRTIVIGPDGKTAISGDSLDGLPESVRKRIEAAVEDAKKTALSEGSRAGKQPNETEGASRDLQKLLREQLKSEGLDDTNMSISRQGSIIVFGPDGKSQTQAFDPSKGIDAGAIVNVISGALGDVELPAEVKEQLEQALTPMQSQKTSAAAGKEAAIVEKLDAILARLEKVESEVRDLKNRE